MRRLSITVIFLAIASPTAVQAQLGIMGGYNRDSFGEFTGPFELSSRIDGFNTGIFLDFEFGRFGIRPAIVYHSLPRAVMEDPDSPATDIDIIELPLEFRIVAPLPLLNPYLVFGPTVMFPSSARPEVDEALAGARLSFGIGVGAEWDLGFRLWPEIRYGTSIGGLVEDDEAGGSRLNTFIARIGISF